MERGREGNRGRGRRGREEGTLRKGQRGGCHEAIELSCLEFKERYNYGHVDLKF